MPGTDSQQRQTGRRLDSGFMEGDTQTSVSSTRAPTLYSYRLVVLGKIVRRDEMPPLPADVRPPLMIFSSTANLSILGA